MRILVAVLSCVGDAIMCTPVLEALRQRYPHAGFDIVGDPRSLELFRFCPYRERLFCKDNMAWMHGFPGLVARLWQRRYDLIVDLRTRHLSRFLRARRRMSKRHALPYGQHAVGRLMGVIRSLHEERPIPAAQLWTDADSEARAQAMLAELPPQPWLMLAPCKGTKRAGEQWPVERYIHLANGLHDKVHAVALLGSGSEAAMTRAIRAQLRLPCVDLAGQTTLLQAAAVLRQARLFVGADSGLGHVAAAAGVPTITVFGQSTPEEYLPWGARAVGLTAASRNAADVSLEAAEAAARKQLAQA